MEVTLFFFKILFFQMRQNTFFFISPGQKNSYILNLSQDRECDLSIVHQIFF